MDLINRNAKEVLQIYQYCFFLGKYSNILVTSTKITSAWQNKVIYEQLVWVFGRHATTKSVVLVKPSI